MIMSNFIFALFSVVWYNMIMTNDEIESLLQSREKARVAKDFKLADTIRDELKKAGVALADTTSGTQATIKASMPKMQSPPEPTLFNKIANGWSEFKMRHLHYTWMYPFYRITYFFSTMYYWRASRIWWRMWLSSNELREAYARAGKIS